MPRSSSFGFNVMVNNEICEEYKFNENSYVEAKENTAFKISYYNYTDREIVAMLYLDGIQTDFGAVLYEKETFIADGFFIGVGKYKEFLFSKAPVVTDSNLPNSTTRSIEVKFFKPTLIKNPSLYAKRTKKRSWKQVAISEDTKPMYNISIKEGNIISDDNYNETYEYDMYKTLNNEPIEKFKVYYHDKQSLEIMALLSKNQTIESANSLNRYTASNHKENPILLIDETCHTKSDQNSIETNTQNQNSEKSDTKNIVQKLDSSITNKNNTTSITDTISEKYRDIKKRKEALLNINLSVDDNTIQNRLTSKNKRPFNCLRN